MFFKEIVQSFSNKFLERDRLPVIIAIVAPGNSNLQKLNAYFRVIISADKLFLAS
jgi:hypothetical protein